MKNILKSVGAVVAGFFTVVVFSIGTDVVLESIGVFPQPQEDGLFVTWMLALAFVYRTVYTILGGYVAAKLAPQNPMKHAIILGLVGTVVGTLGAVAAWDLSPHWYPIALVVAAVPSTWLGGKLMLLRK
jgi:hypothetical protein